MKCLKKFFVCLGLCILLVTTCLSLSVFAAEYSNDYPGYIPVSNCAYVEVNTRQLGTGTLVFNTSYQFNYFGFNGLGLDICNCSNGTISGQFINTSGTATPVRLQSLSKIQYAVTTGYTTTYYDLSIQDILNTNIQFTDNQGDRGNVITVVDHTQKPVFIAVLILIFMFIIHNGYDFLHHTIHSHKEGK